MTTNRTTPLDKEAVTSALSPIVDPDLGLSIIDLGLIYDIRIDRDMVDVDMTLTSMGCPAGEYLYEEVQRTLTALTGVGKVTVNLVWDPPWSEERVEPELRFALGLY